MKLLRLSRNITITLIALLMTLLAATAPAAASTGPTYHKSWYPNGTSHYWPTPDWLPNRAGHPRICARVIGSGTFYINPRYTNNSDTIGHSSPDYRADNRWHCFTVQVSVNAGRAFYARIYTHSRMNEAWAYATY